MDARSNWLTKIRLLSGLLMLLPALASSFADAATAPDVPATSSGSYTVSYGGCGGCYLSWIEEQLGTGGVWSAVGSSPVSFTGKVPGEYHYRAGLLFPSGSYDYYVEYSDTATVIVGTNLPTTQSLTEQFTNEYMVRVGYYDADNTPDLFVERTRGGSGLDGTVFRLILRAGAGKFTPVIPSSSAANAARNWPRASVRIALHDVNLDGFADLLIGGIGRLSGLAGMPAQIVLAPGRVTAAAPLAVRSVAGELRDFGEDVQAYLAEPDYFVDNAPLTVYSATYYDVSCQYSGFDSYLYGVAEYCYPFPITTYLVLPDYSVFADAAVRIWQTESKIEAGTITRYSGYAQIETLVEESLGAPLADKDLRKLLGETDQSIDPTLERGMELFAALAGIGNAVAQDAESGNGTNLPDSVQLRGRRVLGFGPFHTALQYGRSTVSAHDSDPRTLYDGILVSQVNWPPDHPTMTMQLGRATSVLTPSLYWQRLLAADAGYRDRLPYDAIPGIGAGGFNSNGFVAGIVAATSGVTTVPMSRFVGGERPVPANEFN